MNSADLSKILEYEPSTGVFRWNKSKGTALAGDALVLLIITVIER